MDLIWYLLYGYMFHLITVSTVDESISFSHVNTKRTLKSVSYWYGNITISKESSIIDEGLYIQLYLNKLEGLLFYTIDSKYRTLWVEISNKYLTINYYNFRIDDINDRQFSLEKCTQINDNNFDLRFSFKDKNILVTCKTHTELIEYVKPQYPIPKEKFRQFLNNMVLPIPFFKEVNDTNDNIVHIWIGNTPRKNNNEYKNRARLKPSSSDIVGCVKLFSIKNTPLKLASTGRRYGEMIEASCKPVCYVNPCFHNSQCIELWRGRFNCQCGLSYFVGKHCNESYSIKFDRDLSIHLTEYFLLETLQFSFQPVIYGEDLSQKLLSLKFTQNRFLQFYIHENNFLNIRFFTKPGLPKESAFNMKLMDSRNYTVSINLQLNVLHFKLAEYQNLNFTDHTSISLSTSNLPVNEVLFGDSYDTTTSELMNKFHGCLSNFKWTSGNRRFLWNEMRNFSQYKKCGDNKKTSNSLLIPKNGIQSEGNMKSMSPGRERPKEETNATVNNSYFTYIVIGITVIIILLFITILVIYKYRADRKKQKDFFNSQKEIFTVSHQNQKSLEAMGMGTPYIAPLILHNSNQQMNYKPAYKAKSLTSSINGRSMSSLPVTPTPPLVTPEESEKLQYSM